MTNLRTPDQFKSPLALLTMGIVGLVLAYALVSRAFDTGSYWQYLGTLVLVILSTRLIIRSFKH